MHVFLPTLWPSSTCPTLLGYMFQCRFRFSLNVGCKEISCCSSVKKTFIYLGLFPKEPTLKTSHVYRFQFKGFTLSSLMTIFNYEKMVQCKSFFLFLITIHAIYLLVTMCNEVILSKFYNTIIFVLFIF